MPELVNGIVKVGEAVNGWRWEHLQGEVQDLIGTWGYVFKVFYYFCDVVGGYGDFRTRWESGRVVVGVIVHSGTVVGKGGMGRELLLMRYGEDFCVILRIFAIWVQGRKTGGV